MQGVRRLLGGSWVVISRVLSPLIWVISIVTLLITLLITTPEAPSSIHPAGAEGFVAAAVSLRGPAHVAHRGLGAYTQLCSICAQKEKATSWRTRGFTLPLNRACGLLCSIIN